MFQLEEPLSMSLMITSRVASVIQQYTHTPKSFFFFLNATSMS